MAHPKVYPIYELLECMEGPGLQIQNYRSSVTQGRLSERSPREDAVLIERQKPAASYQTNLSLQ